MSKTRKICASCLTFKLNNTVKSSKNKKPKWLDKVNYVDNFINGYKNFKITYPKNYDTTIKINLGKKFANRKILYWAAKPNSLNEIVIKNAKEAYGNFVNHGVASIDNEGFAKLKLCMPQNYKTTIKNHSNLDSFLKHLHYVISNVNNDSWIKPMFTKTLFNNYSYKDFMSILHSKNAVVLNVLSCESYAVDHIKETYNLPKDTIKKMTTNNLENWFNMLIKLHYSKINKLLNNKKLEIYEIPIVCYCAHEKCSASRLATEYLMKKGFVNVSMYKGGLKEYKNNHGK